MSLIDLHSHTAPGVDDGCEDLAESLDTLADFAAQGVRHVVCTPHLPLPHLHNPAMLNAAIYEQAVAIEQLREAAEATGGLPRVHTGQEIWARSAKEIERVLRRNDVGLADTECLLVEFGFRPDPPALEIIRAVTDAGRCILIAHPERYGYAEGTDPIETMQAWVGAGAYLQVNLGSFFGAFRGWGCQSQWLSWAVLEHGLAHVVASDHHGPSRPQMLHQQFAEEMAMRGAAEQAKLLLAGNPRRILEGDRPRPVSAIPAADAVPA
jgi:protein-tyrosine phosphatase